MVEFTNHNIRLDDGTFTKPEMGHSMESYPWFLSAKRVLNTVFPGDKQSYRLADIGCLEGGYAVEFARMGFQVCGIEVREANFAACRYVKSKTDLPNLTFVKDDAWNIARYGRFDAVFCCGLLYHLDRPKLFLEKLSSVTTRLLILQTHFSTDGFYARLPLGSWPRRAIRKFARFAGMDFDFFRLSRRVENEGMPGRWYPEFTTDGSFEDRESARWASWDNRHSFWPQREYLLQALSEVGFEVVAEQFDYLAPDIAGSMLKGSYRTTNRGTFLGIKGTSTPRV